MITYELTGSVHDKAKEKKMATYENDAEKTA